jgi:hypothetical protein
MDENPRAPPQVKVCGTMLRSIIGAAFAAVFLSTSALAIGLTAEDLEYLSGQGVEKSSPLIQGLSPKEIAVLHALINDVRTKDDPVARAAALDIVLNVHREHQRWEKSNPGELWDIPKRELKR